MPLFLPLLGASKEQRNQTALEKRIDAAVARRGPTPGPDESARSAPNYNPDPSGEVDASKYERDRAMKQDENGEPMHYFDSEGARLTAIGQEKAGIPNLGVAPLLSRDEHLAAAAEISDEARINEAAGVYRPPPPGWMSESDSMLPPPPPPVAAQAADGDPVAARQNLLLANRLGMGPEHVAENSKEAQFLADRDAMEKVLPVAPALRQYASQSPVHAAAVADDAGPLAALETAASPAPPPGRYVDGRELVWGFLKRGMLGSWANAQRFWMLIQRPPQSGSFLTGEPVPDAQAKLDELQASIKKTEEATKESVPEQYSDSFVGKVIEAAPGLASIVGATALGGPTGLYMSLFVQDAGNLQRELANDPSLSPEQRDTLAVSAASVSSMIGTGTGARLVGSLLPASMAREAQYALAKQLIEDVLKNKTWKTLLMESGKNALSGTLMNVGMETSDAMMVELARATKEGREINTSQIEQAVRRGLAASVVLAPYGVAGPLLGHAEALGRWWNSEHQNARLATQVEAAKSSKLVQESPAEGKKLIRTMQGENTVYVSAEAYQGAGGEPPPGARATGGSIAVPREDFLMAKDAEALLKDAKLDPDGLTPRESAKEADRLAAERDLLRWQRENSPNMAKLLAEREVVLAGPEEGQREKLREIELKMRTAVWDLPLGSEDIRGMGVGTTTPGAPTAPESIAVDPRLFAQAEVAGRTIGEYDGLRTVYDRAGRSADSALLRLKEQALKASERATAAGQAGTLAGIESGERGRAAAQMNMQFARTARMREWLKGLKMPKGTDPTVIAKTEQGVERWRTETGLYNLPGLGVEAQKSEAQKWFALGEMQRAEAIDRFKASSAANETAEDKYVRSTIEESKAGDAQAQSQAHKRARDVAYALRNELRRNAEEAGKIVNYVALQNTRAARERMYVAGEKYGALYDAIFNGLGVGKERTGGPPPDIDRIINEGDSIPHSQWLKSFLASGGQPLDSMRIDQARAMHEILRALRKMAGDATKTNFHGDQVEREQAIQGMWANLQRITEPGQYVAGEPGTGKQRRYAANSNPEVLTKPLGAWGEDRMTQLYHLLKQESDTQGQFMAQLEIPKELKKASKQMVTFNFFDRTGRLRFLPWEVKRRDVWRMAAMVGNESGMQKMARGFGVSPVEIEHFIQTNMRSKAEWDHVASRWKANEALYALEMETHAKRSDVPPKTLKNRQITTEFGDYTGGYDPFRWFDGQDGIPPPPSAQDPYHGARRQLDDTMHGFVEDRAEGFFSVPDIRHDNLKAHYNALIHDIVFSDYTRDTHRMFHDKAFKDMVRDQLGKDWYDALINWKDVTARGFVVDQGVALPWYDNMLRDVRGLAAQAAFSHNYPVIAGQAVDILHLMPGLGIGPQHVAAGVARALTPEGFREAYLESVVVAFRSDGYREKFNAIISESAQSNRMPHLEAFNKASHEAYHAMDTLTARMVFQSAKHKFLAEGFSKAEAIEKANHMVAQGLPPLSVTQQSGIARDRLWGLLILVRNFPNTLWNVKALMKWESESKIADGASPFWTEASRYGRNIGIIAGLAAGSYLMGQGKRDDENWGQFFARTALLEGVRDKPLLYPAMQAVAPIVFGQKGPVVNYFDTPLSEFANQISIDIGRLANSNRPMTKKMFDALDAAGRILGPPLAPGILRSVKGGVKVYRYYMLGYNDFRRTPRGMGDAASAIFYGERRTGTPLTGAQDLGELLRDLTRNRSEEE